MTKATTATKVTLEEIIAENAQMKENVKMDKFVSEQEQNAEALQVARYMKYYKKDDMARMLVVRDIEKVQMLAKIDELTDSRNRAVLAIAKKNNGTAGEVVAEKPTKVDYRRMLKDEVEVVATKLTKKAEKATATKTTKKATKKSKKTATKSKAVVAEKPTKLTKEERKAISDSKIVHCAGCDAWCTGQGKQTVAEWQAKHIAKITRSVAKESKAKAKKILALHVFVNGPRS
jgi:hypothetical protein